MKKNLTFLLGFTAILAAGVLQEVVDSSTAVQAPSTLEFACNAGNAGNSGILRKLESGPVPAGEVLDGIVAKYNGAEAQPLAVLAARIQSGRVVASGVSEYRMARPGQTMNVARMGYPSGRGLLPAAGVRITQNQLRTVEAHIDARTFLRNVRSGRGQAILSALGMGTAGDFLIIATLPSDESLAREEFTMHPVVLVIDS